MAIARRLIRASGIKMNLMMRNRWEELWRKLSAPAVPQDALEELLRAYSSPRRFYHNLTHIEDCLFVFDQAKFLAIHPEEVELAIWFHDAVYDTRRSDNEQKSAEWAASVINRSNLSSGIAERVSRLVLATLHQAEVRDRDAQVLVDVDLSILGSEAAVFRQYDENIRKEYDWVPEALFQQKRVEILRGFLERPHIYHLEEYRARFEERARANLEQAIARLEETTSAASSPAGSDSANRQPA
jgi:predicted metal-dependent HD superfamily phosphohydrolase